MGHEFMGRVHAALAGARGQGTVEYVGLMLLVAMVLAGVVKAADGFTDDGSIAAVIVDKLKEAVAGVGG